MAVLRILVADDDRVSRLAAVRLVRSLGYHTDEVCNGVEILQALRHQQYDAVLTDIQMPKMTGIEAARQIYWQYPPEGRPLIIVMSATLEQEDLQGRSRAEIDVYLEKPLQLQQLASALQPAQKRLAP